MKSFQKTLMFMAVAILFGFGYQAQAQLHVESSGEVGVGTTTPSAKLDIVNSTSTYGIENRNNYSGSSYKYGIYNYVGSQGTSGRYGIYNYTYSTSSNTAPHRGMYNASYMYGSSTGYGLYNYAYVSNATGSKYGLYNYLNCGSGGSGLRYALYSTVGTNCSGGYAGYFNGNVYVAGSLTQTSDASKKTNIQNLTGALGIVNQLKPKTYDYIDDADLALPGEKQYGFLAQDLEQVLPELVQTIETLKDPEAVEGEEPLGDPEVTGEIKTVNYMAMIPILVEAIQEQQKEIDALKAELAKK